MESKGEVNISPRYKKEDYLCLNLSEQSSDRDWNKAIDILKDRIEGRYFNQIDLLSHDINANGFTIMALNCLLIEALYQFKEGKKQTGNNKVEYSTFLTQAFPGEFNTKHLAQRFYSDIRCGILHSAQTYNESRLSDREDFVVKSENGILLVSVKRISALLRTYFDSYVDKLLDHKNLELRKMFIEKMHYVCKE